MHNTFLKLEQPISHVFGEVGPPERGNAVTQNPRTRPRSTMARADACRGLADQALADRQHSDPGRDDLQPILGSVYVVDKFLKDYFSYSSPARGEKPLPMKTRVPRIPDQDLMWRNAMIIDVGKLMCRRSGCIHGVRSCAHVYDNLGDALYALQQILFCARRRGAPLGVPVSDVHRQGVTL